MAAAWVTFLCYGLMLLLAWGIALRVYPLPDGYRWFGRIRLCQGCADAVDCLESQVA
jgi:hypothetical protein